MSDSHERALAIVGVAAILPDASDARAFRDNLWNARYSIADVPKGRWSVDEYYDPDPHAPDKTYSKIGGWVRGFQFDWKRFHVPPRVAAAMDEGQQWAVTAAAEALSDYGYPARGLDLERTGVVLGAAMGGELHYLTNLRISFPEYARALGQVPEFQALPDEVKSAILSRWHDGVVNALPAITEDSMPGELANVLSGRVANLLNLRGPNFITDAACASSLAALDTAMDLLVERHCDAVITGGVDRNMGVSSFVKFCKIGALSATGTRPFGDGADGFVMGEGCATFLVKRLADAERDGDRIYAVVRGVGGASDGKGKGITAPNPLGQQTAMTRAWQDAGLDPASCSLVEAHGTSTKVGDVVEVESLNTVFHGAGRQSVALGSVKSNLGHLKGAAGAAGLLKAVWALHEKMLPPTLHADPSNPAINFAGSPFFLNNALREWPKHDGQPRRAGVSAYGFGGTNFHVVLEEHVPGQLTKGERPQSVAVAGTTPETNAARTPLRGVVALGAASSAELERKLQALISRVKGGFVPPVAAPDPRELSAQERVVIDFGQGAELLERLQKAERAFAAAAPAAWKALEPQGVFRGSGARPGKLAFLFPGQGSQWVNMGRDLAASDQGAAQVFAEADRAMEALIGGPLTSYIFVDAADEEARQGAELALTQTAITQPAVLTVDAAIARMLGEYGVEPDAVMGHSLGEYAALVAAGVMPFADALEASAARGREMTRVSLEDNGCMAAVIAPYSVVEETLAEIDGYVVAANINSPRQCVIGGASEAVKRAIAAFEKKGHQAIQLPVSHAFHTRIVAPASQPLREVLDRLRIQAPQRPVVSNVTGELYPSSIELIKDLLQRQVASPVRWVAGLETLYASGVRTFVEVGPKKALKGFVDDVLGNRPGVVSLFTNHPKPGELQTFNHALCGLYAAGYLGQQEPLSELATASRAVPAGGTAMLEITTPKVAYDRNEPPLGSVVITGTGLGLPGAEKSVMDPSNVDRILRGEQFVDLIPERFRRLMAAKHVTRLVKSADGSGRFETITDTNDVIKLAGRPGSFDLTEEYGVPEKLVEALDATTQLAMAAGLDALREAGIPLVQTYRKTTKGTYLPDRWLLPEALRDETGVIFASAFPGYDRFADEANRYYTYESRKAQRALLEDVRLYSKEPGTLREITRHLAELDELLAREPYAFDRRFLLRILTMGHSQFAEYVGARGPNAHVNAACASTAQGLSLAEDWIRSGRCRRVVVIGADVASSPHLLEWLGAGFLATGAAATDDKVEEAALPFDKRRHGTLIGMGACALVVESQDAVEERGMRGIVELLASETRNSACHATRLDVDHIAGVMQSLVATAEKRFGIERGAMAPETVFMSHETYTPARGGSASAEVTALRSTFGEAASEIVMANTKGFTGHPMGVGVEDVIAVKILERGIVPPVPNLKEIDPELGPLNLSRGGRYPVKYAIHLAAGFGSQIALTLTRKVPGGPDRVDNRAVYEQWLAGASGYERAATEVVKRVLRVSAQGAPARAPQPSAWAWGTEPTRRTACFDGTGTFDVRPAPLVMPSAPPAMPAPTAAVASTPVVVEVATVVAAQSAPPRGTAHDAVTERVLAIVAEKTGYPPEMLDMDLDLEADLGVDTVKQAETFAAVREAWSIPRQESLKLRDFPTLQHVVKFVLDHRPDLAGASPVEMKAELPKAPSASTDSPADDVRKGVLAIVAEKTGYPPEMLDMDLDLEADLGVDTVKQAETFAAVREAWSIPRQESLKLRDFPTLQHVVKFVLDHRPDLAGARPVEMKAELPKAPSASTASPADDVRKGVLAIVAEKTGYPPEMLDMDLDLEADLGVDTVKQAETFAAVREAWSIPRQESLKLRDFPTLQHVVKFVLDHRPDLAAPQAPPAVQQPVRVAESGSFPRRIAVPSLRPALDLCKPTGVALRAGSRVAVAGDDGGVATALVERLQARGVEVLSLSAAVAAEDLRTRLLAFAAQGPIEGIFWLPALDVEPQLPQLDGASFREHARVRVKNLYVAMRALYEQIAPAGTFLLSATRMGGLFGQGNEGASAPLGGAVAGFTKAYRRERPEAMAKVVDFAPEAGPATIADALIAEALADPGSVEVGYYDGLRWCSRLEERPLPEGRSGIKLGKDTIFLVTGAAGGITSAIVADLAAASGGTFYLLDLVPEPARNDAKVALLRGGREKLKQALIEDAKARGGRPTPVAIEKEMLVTERAEAALKAIEAVERAGGLALYRSVNLLDGSALHAVVEEIRAGAGHIDVLVHAAGIEISHKLPEKETAEFDRVFDVKAEGFFNLLKATEGMPLAATVVFSSVAGRFGNAGQTDYSAANAFLCALSSQLRRVRPETRALAIDWTAWAEIGMATRGSIPTVMAMAGIETLAPTLGVPLVRRELEAAGESVELVVAGKLGAMGAEWDDAGGLALAKLQALLARREHPLVMAGEAKGASIQDGLVVETTLDPAQQPFLFDHQMEGTPVLPGAMGTEAFAEIASVLCPGYGVASVQDEEFLVPFKFHRMRPATFRLTATARPGGPGEILVSAALSSLIRPKPELPPQEKLHFRARIRMTREPVRTPAIAFERPAAGRLTIDADAVYRVYFHGPAYRVLESVALDDGVAIGVMAKGLPPNASPEDAEQLVSPRLLELCFQTAGIWLLARKETMALPAGLGSVKVFRPPLAAGSLYAVVTARGAGELFDARVVDEQGQVYLELSDYRTVALPGRQTLVPDGRELAALGVPDRR